MINFMDETCSARAYRAICDGDALLAIDFEPYISWCSLETGETVDILPLKEVFHIDMYIKSRWGLEDKLRAWCEPIAEMVEKDFQDDLREVWKIKIEWGRLAIREVYEPKEGEEG